MTKEEFINKLTAKMKRENAKIEQKIMNGDYTIQDKQLLHNQLRELRDKLNDIERRYGYFYDFLKLDSC